MALSHRSGATPFIRIVLLTVDPGYFGGFGHSLVHSSPGASCDDAYRHAKPEEPLDHNGDDAGPQPERLPFAFLCEVHSAMIRRAPALCSRRFRLCGYGLGPIIMAASRKVAACGQLRYAGGPSGDSGLSWR